MIVFGLVILAVMFYFLVDKFDPSLMAAIAENTKEAEVALAKANGGG